MAALLVDVSLNTIGATPRLLADAARAAEAAGFDGVWVYDHLSGTSFHGPGAVDVWGALTAVALSTERVAIGPLVLNAPVRHPAHIAVAAATAQAASGGRLRLGLGAGAGPGDPFAAELVMLGLPVLPAAERRARVADTVGYLRALWSGERAYAGTHHRFDDVRAVPAPAPVPPIVIGANGPRLAALAGRIADGVNVHNGQPDRDGIVAVAIEHAGDRPFEVSVEGPFDAAWLDPDGDARGRLDAIGVHRIMARWSPSLGLGAFAGPAR
jgi:alkanesulfonate monooxygenase SsuD/methylene tetrahydromethanopterin reductase-like flavin-dependent oxidoreductase (luciferase family)